MFDTGARDDAMRARRRRLAAEQATLLDVIDLDRHPSPEACARAGLRVYG